MSVIKKNTITIFLASSDELINDRNSFQALISSLDDIYESRGIRVKCKRWEDFVAYCTGERTQDDYNKVLSNSDICICMFHRKAGAYTVEEFNHAMDEYNLTKDHPKTYVYARAIVDGEIEEEELKQFKADLFKKMGHYWCNYQTGDAMKLHFIMQFERILNADSDRLGQTSANIKVENGNVLLHGRKIADYSNLPFASANSELQMLKDQVAELDKEIATLSALGVDALLPTINEKKSKRYDTNEQLKQLENQLLEMALSINRMISSGEPISERKRMAIEMFEAGNTKGVLEVLNEKDIASDIEDSRQRRDNALCLAQSYQEEAEFETRKIRSLIEEYILKAKNCMSVYSDSDRLSKACALYEKAIESTRQNLSEEDLAKQLFNYAYFLQDHNQFHLVESFYVESLDIYERLSQNNPEAYEPDLARSLNCLAILYRDIQRFVDSETYHLRAIEIRERLSQNNPEAYESDLAQSLNNLGILYCDIQRFDDSETYHLRALEIRERLSQNNPEVYEPHLADSLNNLGILYNVTQRFDDSEVYYLRALDIYERLSQANPKAYEPRLANFLNNLGALYRDIQRFFDSETYYLRALEIRERLSQTHPEAYEPDLADSLNNLAILYSNTQRFSDSETYHLRAIEIRERLSQNNPEAYEPDLAQSLHNLGCLYYETQRFDDSEVYYLRALEIRERLSQANPKAYEPYLADSLNNLAILYRAKKNSVGVKWVIALAVIIVIVAIVILLL